MAKEQAKERRECARVPVDLPVTLRSPGAAPVPAKIINLTVKGGGILYPVPIPMGSVIELRFHVSYRSMSRELRLQAKAIHSHEAEVR